MNPDYRLIFDPQVNEWVIQDVATGRALFSSTSRDAIEQWLDQEELLDELGPHLPIPIVSWDGCYPAVDHLEYRDESDFGTDHWSY